MTATEATGADALTLRVNGELLTTDSLMAHLEHRVIALEAIVATPWPLRIVAAWRLMGAVLPADEREPVNA